jgi:hypothetical protein
MNLSRRKFLIFGGLATVGAAAATIETLPLLRGSDGELRLHLEGKRSFSTLVPYDCQVKGVYPIDPGLRLFTQAGEIHSGTTLQKGESLQVASPMDHLDLIIQVRRL